MIKFSSRIPNVEDIEEDSSVGFHPLEQEDANPSEHNKVPQPNRNLAVASCCLDSIKVGTAAGAAVGFGTTAAIGGLLSAPFIYCSTDKAENIKEVVIKDAKKVGKVTGACGALAGGFFGLKAGCFVGFFSAPFVYFAGKKPEVCNTLNNKLNDKVNQFIDQERPRSAPSDQRMVR